MDYDWIEFGEPPPNPNDGMYVSLCPDRLLFFNKKVHEAMGSPAAVQLLYSKRTDMIGLRSADLGMENAYEVKLRNRSGSRRVLLTSFCKKHGIKYRGNVQFLDIKVENGVLILNLLKTRLVTRPRKNKPSRS